MAFWLVWGWGFDRGLGWRFPVYVAGVRSVDASGVTMDPAGGSWVSIGGVRVEAVLECEVDVGRISAALFKEKGGRGSEKRSKSFFHTTQFERLTSACQSVSEESIEGQSTIMNTRPSEPQLSLLLRGLRPRFWSSSNPLCRDRSPWPAASIIRCLRGGFLLSCGP